MRAEIFCLFAMAFLTAPASAAVYTPGGPQFTMLPRLGMTIYNSPVINGFLGALPSTAGTFTDDFEFALPQSGFASGSIITTADSATSANYIEFLSVVFDGTAVPVSIASPASGGIEQTAGLAKVAILKNALNTLQITYHTLGAGSYGGQLTFESAAVPEPASWVTALLGFAIMGLAMRRNARKSAQSAKLWPARCNSAA